MLWRRPSARLTLRKFFQKAKGQLSAKVAFGKTSCRLCLRRPNLSIRGGLILRFDKSQRPEDGSYPCFESARRNNFCRIRHSLRQLKSFRKSRHLLNRYNDYGLFRLRANKSASCLSFRVAVVAELPAMLHLSAKNWLPDYAVARGLRLTAS